MKHHAFFTCLLLITAPFALFSQSNIYGGYISVEQIGPCSSATVRATVLVYSTSTSPDLDRETIRLYWGDGTSDEVPRLTNSNSLPDQDKVNIYVANHTYSGPGVYQLHAEDCCLTTDLTNVSPKAGLPFKASVSMALFAGQFQGCNSSPVSTSSLLDFGLVNQIFTFNTGVYDTDGDSLSYAIVNPLPEFDYQFPNEIEPGNDNNFSIHPVTGTIKWETPKEAGNYLVGLTITAFRDQNPVSEVFGMMQIRITDPDILLFPNPATEYLTITALPAVGDEEEFHLRLYNPLGQLVLEQSGAFVHSSHTIEVKDFANGTYFLEFEMLGKKWSRKFLKL